MRETLNLVAILDDMNPSMVWRKLSQLDYIEETDEGLSFVIYDKIKGKKLGDYVYQITLNGIKSRGYLQIVNKDMIEQILNFKSNFISRPLFGLMPDQKLMTFTFETKKGFGVEYIEYMLTKIEKDLGIEFEPAEDYELEDFTDANDTFNLDLLKKIAEDEGEYDTWDEDGDDADYPRRYINEKDSESKQDVEIEKKTNPDNKMRKKPKIEPKNGKKNKKNDNPFW